MYQHKWVAQGSFVTGGIYNLNKPLDFLCISRLKVSYYFGYSGAYYLSRIVFYKGRERSYIRYSYNRIIRGYIISEFYFIIFESW